MDRKEKQLTVTHQIVPCEQVEGKNVSYTKVCPTVKAFEQISQKLTGQTTPGKVLGTIHQAAIPNDPCFCIQHDIKKK